MDKKGREERGGGKGIIVDAHKTCPHKDGIEESREKLRVWHSLCQLLPGNPHFSSSMFPSFDHIRYSHRKDDAVDLKTNKENNSQELIFYKS